MKLPKKNPRKQLEKFSTIFMQLGLVLTLFVVFVSLEHESVKKVAVLDEPYDDSVEVVSFTRPVIVKRVEKKAKPIVKKQNVTRVIQPQVVKNTEEVITTVIVPVKDEPTVTVATTPTKVVPTTTENPVSVRNVQNMPVFKGCEGLSEEESRKCFERKIQRHVQRYFDSELAQDVGLDSGKYKIYTQFIIDKSGEVSDVKIRAPHKRLEKEASKVVHKIPAFKPGKQNNKPVKVKYTLPITFKVD